MTTESSSTPATSRKATNGSHVDELSPVQGAIHEVRGALEGASRSLPAAVRASQSAVGDLYRVIDAGSDERIANGVTLSLGLAIGMLVGGAPRLLVALALAPLVAMGLVLADRRATVSRAARS
jgi:hypothetical protein